MVAGSTNWIAPLSSIEPMYSLIIDQRPT